MCDIFISYAKVDVDRTRVLAQALENQGWSVFWDRTIPPGEHWVKYIGSELDGAKCVLVLWSKTAIESSWVYEEADRARRRGVLIPLLIDNVSPPLGFGGVQAANLTHWKGDASDSEFRSLVDAIIHLLGGPSVEPASLKDSMEGKTAVWPPDLYEAKPARRYEKFIPGAIVVAVILGILGAGLFYYFKYIPDDEIGQGKETVVELEPADVKRLRFAVQELLEKVNNARATAEQVNAIDLAAEPFRNADRAQQEGEELVASALSHANQNDYETATTVFRQAQTNLDDALKKYAEAERHAVERAKSKYDNIRATVQELREKVNEARTDAEQVNAIVQAAEPFRNANLAQQEGEELITSALSHANRNDYETATTVFRQAQATLENAFKKYAEAERHAVERAKSEYDKIYTNALELKNKVVAVQRRADELGARKHAAKLFKNAVEQASIGNTILQQSERLSKEESYIKATQMVHDAQSRYKNALDLFNNAAQMSRFQKDLETALELQQRARNARQSAERAGADRLAVELYQKGRTRYDEGSRLLSKSRDHIERGASKQAKEVLDAAVVALNDARKIFVDARATALEPSRIAYDRARNRMRTVQQEVAKAREKAVALEAATRAADMFERATELEKEGNGLLGEAVRLAGKDDYDGALGNVRDAEAKFKHATTDFLRAKEMASRLNANDMAVLNTRLSRFKRTYEARDLDEMSRISEMSSQRKRFLRGLFQDFSTIKVSFDRLSGSAAEVSVVVSIDRLITRDGDQAIPGSGWKDATLSIKKSHGEWGRIVW